VTRHIDVPGGEDLRIGHMVLDVNGTLTTRGHLLEGVQERLQRLRDDVALHALPVIVLDESRLGAPWDAVAGAANWLIWLAFAVETVVMLALAPEKRRWLRQHPLELGTAFAAVEHAQDLTPWDGVWWAIVTVTTVGYGDIVPKTDAGRVIGVIVMLGGIGFLAVLTAAIAQRFIAVGAAGPGEDPPPGDDGRLARLERKLDRLHERLDGIERGR
jgi:voltage-gated potassium channel Kch